MYPEKTMIIISLFDDRVFHLLSVVCAIIHVSVSSFHFFASYIYVDVIDRDLLNRLKTRD